MSTINRLNKPEWELCLCKLAHRGVLAPGSWWWDLLSFLKSVMGGLLVASPSCPSYAAAASCTACCKLHWCREDLFHGEEALPSLDMTAHLNLPIVSTKGCARFLYVWSKAFWGHRSPQVPVGRHLCCWWVAGPILAGSFPVCSSKLL